MCFFEPLFGLFIKTTFCELGQISGLFSKESQIWCKIPPRVTGPQFCAQSQAEHRRLS